FIPSAQNSQQVYTIWYALFRLDYVPDQQGIRPRTGLKLKRSLLWHGVTGYAMIRYIIHTASITTTKFGTKYGPFMVFVIMLVATPLFVCLLYYFNEIVPKITVIRGQSLERAIKALKIKAE